MVVMVALKGEVFSWWKITKICSINEFIQVLYSLGGGNNIQGYYASKLVKAEVRALLVVLSTASGPAHF